jgi:deoxyribonuclease V
LGLASHLGIILDIPTIGCAKSVLVGHYVEPPVSKGSVNPLIYQDQEVGAVVRTRRGVKPVFVSIGHKILLKMAVKIILRCSPRYRIPEPLRLAHRKVNELRKMSTLVRK